MGATVVVALVGGICHLLRPKMEASAARGGLGLHNLTTWMANPWTQVLSGWYQLLRIWDWGYTIMHDGSCDSPLSGIVHCHEETGASSFRCLDRKSQSYWSVFDNIWTLITLLPRIGLHIWKDLHILKWEWGNYLIPIWALLANWYCPSG